MVSKQIKFTIKKFKDKKVGLVYGKFYKVNNENFLKKTIGQQRKSSYWIYY